MKKIYLVVLIAVLYPLFFHVASHAACKDGDITCNGFVSDPEIKLCDPGRSVADGVVSFQMNTVQMDEAIAKMSNICKKTSAPADFLVSYSATYGIDWFGVKLQLTYIGVCKDGYYTPKNIDGSSYYAPKVPNTPISPLWQCCPPAFPYAALNGVLDLNGCTDIPNGLKRVGVSRQAVSIPIKIDYTASGAKWYVDGSNPYLENPSHSAYICGYTGGSHNGEGCAVTAFTDGFPEGAKYNTYLRSTEIGGSWCIQNKMQTNINSCTKLLNATNDSCMCYNGSSISKALFDKVGPEGVKILDQCKTLPGGQSGQCVNCMAQNFKQDGKGNIITEPQFTFSSSFGCIDTSKNGFITRVLQIALGIGGGIAVVRLIQGAVERQSNDPAKVQDGNEKFVTAILFLITMVSAIFIFRIIGVDVLGIFTIGQFNIILGQ